MACEINFITGRAGSGKSAYVRERIQACLAHGGKPALVVPEQFTFEAERELSEAELDEIKRANEGTGEETG